MTDQAQPASKSLRMVMVVMNDITADGRVKKTAATAAALGFDTHVVGVTAGEAFMTTMGPVLLHRVRPVRSRPPLVTRHHRQLVLNILAPVGYRDDAALDRAVACRRSPVADGNDGRLGHFARRAGGLWFRIRRKGLFGQFVVMGPSTDDRDSIVEFVRRELGGLVPATEAIVSRLRELDPDLVHAHDITTLHVPAYSVELGAPVVPWVYDAHEWVAGIGASSSARIDALTELESRLARKADAVITVSPTLADLLERHRGLSRRPEVVLNLPPRPSPDAGDFPTIRVAVGLDSEVPLLVYPGVVKPARGLEAVVDALPELPDVHIALVTVVDGAHVVELIERAERLGVADRVHVHPYVDPEMVPAFLADATIGVHPLTRYANAEVALPTKLFEFVLAGLPCVVSDVAAMADFVADTGVGVTFPAGDAQRFADAVREVLADPGRYRSRITDELRDKYVWEAQQDTLRAVYSSLIPLDPDRAQFDGALVLHEQRIVETTGITRSAVPERRSTT